MNSSVASNFIYHRFTSQGTLSEPDGVPEPRFALLGTVNWMRALAILTKAEGISRETMAARYVSVSKANLADPAINTVFEQLLMSLHHLSAVRAMAGRDNSVDLARSAIVTWYYGIYHAASAMIAAQDGSHQDNHGETANAWDRQFAELNLIPRPFCYRVSSMVKKVAEAEIIALRAGNSFDLNTQPTNEEQAMGACLSYLKGSVEWRVWLLEQELKRKELKKLELTNFRTKQAQQLRDGRLDGRSFGFVHQAFRYRGKANYREALFISYGSQVAPMLTDFYTDLFTVLGGFLTMSGAFCGRRIGGKLWNDFLNDLISNCPLSVSSPELWSKLKT